jgi:uncharacterized protein YkwD
VDQWYARFVTAAVCSKFVRAYPDGTFRPLDPVSFREAAIMYASFFHYPLRSGIATDEASIWALSDHKAIPFTIGNFDALLTRGEMAEILYRLSMNITNRPSNTYEELHLARSGSLYAAADSPSTAAAEMLFHMINVERGKQKLSPLKYSRKLDDAATKHALDMVTRNYYSHTSPDGVEPDARIRATGYFTCTNCDRGWKYHWGENIASDSSATNVIQSWLESPAHRAILLSDSFTDVGIGVSGERWVADFGGIEPQ